MIEDIFLTYANYSLKDHPKKLHNIFKKFSKLGISIKHPMNSDYLSIIDYFIALVKSDDLRDAEINLEKKHLKVSYDVNYRVTKNYHDLVHYQVAFEAIYGYKNGYCEENCFDRFTRESVLGSDFFDGEKRLKCYECDQQIFKKILDGLAEGKKYSEIAVKNGGNYLLDILLNSHSHVIELVNIIRYPSSGIEELIVENIISDRSIDYSDKNDDRKNNFHELFFLGIIGYSLTEFLLNNDPRKIKKCPYCNKFYIAKDIKRKNRCYSDDCRKAYERNKKRMQRDKDPVKYC